MKFFIPGATNAAEANVVLEAIARFVSSALPKQRIFRLAYRHNGMDMTAEVGKPAHPYYNEGADPVVAILGENPHKVCLPNRGVLRGEPIYVGNVSAVEYFDFDPNALTGKPWED